MRALRSSLRDQVRDFCKASFPRPAESPRARFERHVEEDCPGERAKENQELRPRRLVGKNRRVHHLPDECAAADSGEPPNHDSLPGCLMPGVLGPRRNAIGFSPGSNGKSGEQSDASANERDDEHRDCGVVMADDQQSEARHRGQTCDPHDGAIIFRDLHGRYQNRTMIDEKWYHNCRRFGI